MNISPARWNVLHAHDRVSSRQAEPAMRRERPTVDWAQERIDKVLSFVDRKISKLLEQRRLDEPTKAAIDALRAEFLDDAESLVQSHSDGDRIVDREGFIHAIEEAHEMLARGVKSLATGKPQPALLTQDPFSQLLGPPPEGLPVDVSTAATLTRSDPQLLGPPPEGGVTSRATLVTFEATYRLTLSMAFLSTQASGFRVLG